MSDIDATEIETATGGRYRVERLIGEGGMGAVFLAIHHELGSRVAIKILPPEVRSHGTRLARFRREAAVAAKLSHPNLVPVFEFEAEAHIAYLVMPYVEGPTLAEVLEQNGPMSQTDVEQLVRQVGAALAHAHDQGVIHRDIKPANLIQEQNTGRWMVTDFGVAHVSTPDDQTALTGTDATIGTVAYMAPEQLGGAREVDRRADLYALACVAYEALTGEWHTREGVEAARKVLLERRHDLGEPFIGAVTAPLAEARDMRPPTVAAWLDLIIARGSRRGWYVPAAIAFAGLLGTMAVLSLIGGPPPVRMPLVAVVPFTNTGPRTNLDSMLSQLISWEVQKLPQYRIIEDTRVRTELNQRFGNALPSIDSIIAYLGTALAADEVVTGQVDVRGDNITIRLDVFDASNGSRLDTGERTDLTDNITAVVGNVVVDAFAQRLAEEWSGAGSSTLPSTLPAVVAYFEGDRAFRRGDLDRARVLFDEVISLDSTYAPAFLKKVLVTALRVRPSEATAHARDAVLRASRYRDRLDLGSQQLLDAYRALLVDGDVLGALETGRRIVRAYPDAIDAWFLIGALQTLLPSLTQATGAEARLALREVVDRDPTFAAAYGMLIQVAIAGERVSDARSPIDRFLEIDSTSTNAQLVRVVDTLLFQPTRRLGLLQRLPDQPAEVLENLALGSVDLHPPPGGRAISIAAINALRSGAQNPADRDLAFRLRMAAHFGSGEVDAARRLFQAGPTLGVSQGEMDRWGVLGAVTDMPRLLPDPDEVPMVVSRLAANPDEPVINQWLAARWALLNGTPSRPLTASDSTGELVTESLNADLRGLTRLLAADTAGALEAWENATSRYSIEEILTGIVSSLWVTRSDLIRVAYHAGQYARARTAGRTFSGRVGIMDQVVWSTAFEFDARSAIAMDDRAGALATLNAWRRHLADDHPERTEIDLLIESLEPGP